MIYFKSMNPTHKNIFKIAFLGILIFTASCKKAPTVCFNNNVDYQTTASSSHVNVPLSFHVMCDRDANKYEWDFGDTTGIVEGANVTHTYTKVGTYTISLTGTRIRKNAKKNTATTVTQSFTITP